MRGVTKALSSLRPAGGAAALRLTSRAQFTHHYGTGTGRRWWGKGSPINYMGNCARIIYVRIHRHEPRALGHAVSHRTAPLRIASSRTAPHRTASAAPSRTEPRHIAPHHARPRQSAPRHAIPHRAVPCRSSPQRLSIARQRGHK